MGDARVASVVRSTGTAPPPTRAGTSRRAVAPGVLLGLGALVLLAGPRAATAEDQRCKGTKQFYAGKCRYPDEIGRLRDEERKRREAAEQAKQKAEQERLRQERELADQNACAEAEADGSKQGWARYLEAHPDGFCAPKARDTVAAIEAAEKPATPPTGGGPDVQDAASTQPSDASADWTPTTLFWAGAAVTAAGAITWAVAGGILVGKSSDLEAQCPNQQCPADRQSDLDSAELTAHVTTVGAVVTAAGAAVTLLGALWPLFDSSAEAGASPDAARQSTARVTPLLGLSYVGLRADF